MRKRNEKKSILNGRRRQDMQRKRRKHDTYIERVKNEMIEDFLKDGEELKIMKRIE